MLINNGDDTFIGGPLDVLCILHNVKKGTYHASFFEEKPMPGPVPDWKDVTVVRLKSKFSHTEGAPTLEGALKHLDDLATTIEVPPENIWREPRPWDGEIGIVWIANNWRVSKEPVVLAGVSVVVH